MQATSQTESEALKFLEHIKELAKSKKSLEAQYFVAHLNLHHYAAQLSDNSQPVLLQRKQMMLSLGPILAASSQSIFVEKNPQTVITKSVNSILDAAERGLHEARLEAGQLLLEGKFVEKDILRAERFLLGLKMDGAGILLGVLYQDNDFNGVRRNDLAFRHFLEAGLRGNPLAQHNIGTYYFSGQAPSDTYLATISTITPVLSNLHNQSSYPTEKSIRRAMEWWTLAATQKFAISMYNLGKLWLEGVPVEATKPLGGVFSRNENESTGEVIVDKKKALEFLEPLLQTEIYSDEVKSLLKLHNIDIGGSK
ncbi:hypothetical protein HK096_006316 [Nowakowskiella sp. JEL0078]|nr:hypothetical protein HK096_006316 [Nowakowskiella sp. JEL0078]